MDETFDAAGVALCCAAAIRLGGAVRVLIERSALLWSSLVFGTVVLTRPKQQNITAAQALSFSSTARWRTSSSGSQPLSW